MPSLSETFARLQSNVAAGAPFQRDEASARLTPLRSFGANPGGLGAWEYMPPGVAKNCPLVVVLHGCTQSAGGYDVGSGWSALAERFGFAVVFAEQHRTNNLNLCFNWFSPKDTRRGGGEAQSIRDMVASMIERHPIDPARVFVTGLSAGGAMTSVMLATYPEVFAGGAIIAGLPYGVAETVSQALERMRGQGFDRAHLSALVRNASTFDGRWPSVSVWHGTADATVAHANAALIVDQWRGVHNIHSAPVSDHIDGQVHRTWRDGRGRAAIEEYVVAGMAHGTPIATTGAEASGTPAPYFLEAGISSTYRIAANWGIVPATVPARRPAEPSPAAGQSPAAGRHCFDPGRVIHDALRAAGLFKR